MKIGGSLAAGAMMLAAASIAWAGPDASDVVFLHGRIHTEDANRSVAQALALRGNSILAVGTDQAVSALVGRHTRTVDLGGKVVLPGIIDAHIHPAESSQDLDKCSLGDETLTPAEIKARVTHCLKQQPSDRSLWFEVVQVNASGLTLTLKDLDAILADRPMLLESADGHTVWANSAALRASHIDAGTLDPTGGRILHDAGGNPTGTLRDTAAEIALGAKPSPSVEFEAAQLARAFDAMRAVGITSVQDADTDDHDMQMYRRLYDTHRLNMRVRATFGLKDTNRSAAVLIGEAIKFRARWAVDPEFLRADAVKIFADA